MKRGGLILQHFQAHTAQQLTQILTTETETTYTK